MKILRVGLWQSPLMRVLAIGPLLIGLVGCAESVPHPATSDTDVEADQQKLDALVQSIEGTREDRLAGEVLVFRHYQDALSECMKERGFTYEPPAFVDSSLALPDPIVLNTEWLDPLSSDYGLPTQARAATIVGKAQLIQENKDTPYLHLTPDEQKAYIDALGTCDPGDSSALATFPSGFDELRTSLQELLTTVSDQLESYGPDYSRCMASNGVELESRLDAFDKLVYGEPPYPDGSDQVASATWNDWVSKVHSIASADEACRREAYEMGMQTLSPLLGEFR